ncbi:hypothetical protein GYMLUDRAFT_248203 [Collybiopsis luxurians FD-317 M1]|uniref:Uncharacterized protein n=1 Tax=Collybiopsis luxurians FD-317 M1 TaxID=944289 RepID=A0A0D0C0V8_9AGAR|nr:hypothetical protein GYMLUDRAFT_248203 [Collybiopsis luxurians FD-317 M1]
MATEVKLAIREFGFLESNNVSVVIGSNSNGNGDRGSDNGNDDGNVTIDQGNIPDTSTTSSSSTASATSARATSPVPAISNRTPLSNVIAPTDKELIYPSRFLSSSSPPAVSSFPEVISKSSGPISAQSSLAQTSRSQSLSAQTPISQSFNSQLSLPPESSSSIPTHLSSGVASPKSHKAVSAAAIAGSVVGSIVALIIASFCLFCFLRRRRARNQLSPSQLITAFATTETPIKLPRTTGHIIPEKVSRSMGLTPDYNLAEFESRLLPAYGAGIMAHMSNPPVPTGSVVGSEVDNAEPVATRLESMQNLITQIMGHVRQLETEREHDGDSVTMGSILPPPPTYASE